MVTSKLNCQFIGEYFFQTEPRVEDDEVSVKTGDEEDPGYPVLSSKTETNSTTSSSLLSSVGVQNNLHRVFPGDRSGQEED